MKNQITLTEDQLAQYREEGYVILGRVMDDATLEELRAEEARFRGERDPKELTVFRSQLSNYSEPLRRFCTSAAHVPLLQQLIGPNVAFWFNQYVTKWPDAASGKSEFPWHQDNGYVAIEPATNVTIWFALDDVDEHNGCVWIAPRSHKRGLLDHRQKSAESWHLTVPVEGDGVPARLRAGEAVAFSGLTLHRSKLNHTDRPRRAFFIEYADAQATYRRPQDPASKAVPVLDSHQSWMVLGRLDWPPPTPVCLY
jgi:ectoine hydroxylase-related dioxygenase (phytanoyl-CoA dioxygenase family)